MNEDLSKATIYDFVKRSPSTGQFMPTKAVLKKLILRATQVKVPNILSEINPKEEICDPAAEERILDPAYN
jgi:hypothetical protein